MQKPLQIVKYPNSILKTRAKEISEFDSPLRTLISQMIATMNASDGVGLAAPQIGISERIIIVKDANQDHGFINPEIVKKSKEREIEEEGCLSLPGIFVKVKRSTTIHVVAKTAQGKVVRISAKGLGARIFQHEIDHLNGKLIINRISAWKRFQLRKKIKAIAQKSE